ncbi:MAG TPA: ester cyclase [Herpetosiphonaceae bacterium]
MSATANQALVRTFFDAVWNQGDETILDNLLAPRSGRSIATRLSRDTAYIRANVRILRAAFPDWRVTIEEMIAMPDRVLTRWCAEGTHLGSFMGFAPTGRRISATGISIFYITGGRIQDARVSRDSLSMLRQVCAGLSKGPTAQRAISTVTDGEQGEALALGGG